MSLSFVRSWRRATDSNLITRVGESSAAPARLSRGLTTQTAWRRNLSRVVECHELLGPLIRRLYHHQAAAERSEPGEGSLTPNKATPSFHTRQLRARQLSLAKASRPPALPLTENPQGKTNPPNVPVRNHRKHSNSRARRASRRAHISRETGASETQTEENQESTIDSADYKGDEIYYGTWAPVEAADVEHFHAVQTAVAATRKAEDVARWADKADEAASAAIVSSSEKFAIRLADAARTEAELAALDAKQKAQLAADKEEAAEAIRAELRALVEKRLPVFEGEELGHLLKLRGLVHSPCRVCHSPHSLADCKVLFPALGPLQSKTYRRNKEHFRDRLAIDEKFREAMEFIQSTFNVGPNGDVILSNSHGTHSAPPSAIKYLQEFDTRVIFKSIINGKDGPDLAYVAQSWAIHSGHYLTKDDDGRTFAIYWPTNAPTNIATDPWFLPEVQMIQSFVAAWRRGEKARYGQDTFGDMPSIDIVICVGRWHQSLSRSGDMYRSVMSLCASNKELWKQGKYYRGFHIGTKDDKITSGYGWWAYGRPETPSSGEMRNPEVNLRAAPIQSWLWKASPNLAVGLLRATLRSVEERAQPILAKDLRQAVPAAVSRFKKYQIITKTQAIQKYGRNSVQNSLIKTYLPYPATTTKLLDHKFRQWAPSWETMMRLDQSEPAPETRKPRTPPRTLRRRRLLRPHTFLISDSTSADPPAWVRDDQMSSITSPDTAPEIEAVSSSGVEPLPVDPVSTPSTSQQKTSGFQGFQTRKILYAADSVKNKSRPEKTHKPRNSTPRAEEIPTTLDFAPETAGGGSRPEENSTRRVPRPRNTRKPRSSTPWVVEQILTTLDLSPETVEAGSSEPEQGREAVEYRPKAWGRRQKGTRKSPKAKARHNFPVPDSGDVCSF